MEAGYALVEGRLCLCEWSGTSTRKQDSLDLRFISVYVSEAGCLPICLQLGELVEKASRARDEFYIEVLEMSKEVEKLKLSRSRVLPKGA